MFINYVKVTVFIKNIQQDVNKYPFLLDYTQFHELVVGQLQWLQNWNYHCGWTLGFTLASLWRISEWDLSNWYKLRVLFSRSYTKLITGQTDLYYVVISSGVPRGVGVFNPHPPKFRSFDKAEPNSQFRGKYIRNNLIRIRVSLICSLCGTPDWGATAPRSPFSLPSVLNWICWTHFPRTKFLGTPLVIRKKMLHHFLMSLESNQL
jgi:hypothetical protein